jgi:hypothetical protein
VASDSNALSPRFIGRIAGVCYLVTFLSGGLALLVHGPAGLAAGLVAAVSYIAVTLLFYFIFRSVSKRLSLLATLISLAGCGIGPVSMALKLHVPALHVSLVLFGLYCLLIGYLIFQSTFLPHVLGALMAFAGLGWLCFASPPLSDALYPYILAPGMIGEGSLTVWLLLFGVNADTWTDLSAMPKKSLPDAVS